MEKEKRNRVKELFLYAGLRKEDYKAVAPRVNRQNANQVRILSFVLALLSAILFAWSYVDTSFAFVRDTMLTSFPLCILIGIFMGVSKTVQRRAYFMGYILIMLGYICGFILSLSNPGKQLPSITAICILVLLPMVIIDVPWRMAAAMLIGMTAFLGMSWDACTREIFIVNYIHLIPLASFSFVLFTIISCTSYGYAYRNYSAEKQLMELSDKDQLTGALNRNGLHRFLDPDGVRIAMEREVPVCILMLDIDFFKKVNDTYGHDAGDRILVFMADTVRSCVRETDRIVRWGGEEFLIFLMDTERDEGLEIAERIRSAVESSDNGVCKITVSIGAAVYDGNNYQNAVKRADEGLYYAKEHGRNQVVEPVMVNII